MSRITLSPTGDDRLRNRCRRARQHASELLDGELGLPARFRLRAHLATCDECRHFGQELRSLTLRLRGHELGPAPVRALALERRRRRKLFVPGAVALAASAVVAVAVVQLNAAHRTHLQPRTEGIFLRVESKLSYDHTTHMS
jgi:anti-sigma factor RsiW